MTSESFESKVTANIDSDIYNAVAKNFHYGQRAIFFRKLFESLKKLVDKGAFHEVTEYMYNDADLILPGK